MPLSKVVPKKHHRPAPAKNKQTIAIRALHAEHLVIHEMLDRDTFAIDLPPGFPEIDVLVFGQYQFPQPMKTAAVQCKSTANSTIVKLHSLSFHFLVVVRKNNQTNIRTHQETWVIPRDVVEKYWSGNAINLANIPDEYKVPGDLRHKDPWQQIIHFLEKDQA